MSGLNRDEWLKAVEEAGIRSSVDDQGALTRNEFAEMFGLNVSTASEHLVKLVAIGKAIKTTKRALTRYGRMVNYTAYRLVDPPKKKAKR